MVGTGKSKGTARIYSTNIATDAKSSREAEGIYNSWAEDYEGRILSYGYSTPAVAAGLLGRYVQPKDQSVLDAGAGTGMIGEILAPLGYHHLVGIDISDGMLKLARKKGVYSDLRQMELGQHLDFPTDTFGAVVSTGVFAAGHAPPQSFDELIRVTRPGGYLIFSVRTDVHVPGGFKDRQEVLERQQKWQLIAMTRPFSHLRFEDPDLKVRLFVYRAL